MKSSRFAVAAHILVSIEYRARRRGDEFVSSATIATSINTNPVFVRELLRKLCKAGLVITKEGSGGGVQLARPASEIDLGEVYRAVEEHPLLKQNCRPAHEPCPVSCGMNAVLEPVVDEVEKAMFDVLVQKKLSDLVSKIDK